MKGPSDATCFLRVGLDSASHPPRITLVGPQGSGLVRTLHAADGLAVLPDGVREIAEGEFVDVMLIDDAPAAEPFRAV